QQLERDLGGLAWRPRLQLGCAQNLARERDPWQAGELLELACERTCLSRALSELDEGRSEQLGGEHDGGVVARLFPLAHALQPSAGVLAGASADRLEGSPRKPAALCEQAFDP